MPASFFPMNNLWVIRPGYGRRQRLPAARPRAFYPRVPWGRIPCALLRSGRPPAGTLWASVEDSSLHGDHTHLLSIVTHESLCWVNGGHHLFNIDVISPKHLMNVWHVIVKLHRHYLNGYAVVDVKWSVNNYIWHFPINRPFLFQCQISVSDTGHVWNIVI